MVYSKVKPYNKTSYKGAADPSYDRFLKEAVNLGKAENVKESELEKPYNVKQTYGAMQQNYNPVTPPVIDPGPGTGGLNCLWTSTGCEQLVGCWAGSDIVLDGPEAATAGYMPVEVLTGAIVKHTVGGSEGRGIELIMSPIPQRNTFNVKFKDGLGIIHTQLIDIVCPHGVAWDRVSIYNPGSWVALTDTFMDNSNGYLHNLSVSFATFSLFYNFFDGNSWTAETIAGFWFSCPLVYIDVLGNPSLLYLSGTDIVGLTKSSGTWNSFTALSSLGANLVLKAVHRDSSGYTHLIYVYENLGVEYRVYYATDSSGSWQTELLVTLTVTGSWEEVYQGITSAIDSSDNVHVIYYQQQVDTTPNPDVYETKFYHIYGTYGSWSAPVQIGNTITVFDTYKLVCSVDASNRVHFAISSGTEFAYYLYNGSWNTKEVITSSVTNLVLNGVVSNLTDIFCTAYLNLAPSEELLEYTKATTWTTQTLADTYIGASGKLFYYPTGNVLYLVCLQSSTVDGTTGALFHYYRYL
jgi:hypothetical protein